MFNKICTYPIIIILKLKCKCYTIPELISDAGVIIYIGGFLLIIAFIR